MCRIKSQKEGGHTLSISSLSPSPGRGMGRNTLVLLLLVCTAEICLFNNNSLNVFLKFIFYFLRPEYPIDKFEIQNPPTDRNALLVIKQTHDNSQDTT